MDSIITKLYYNLTKTTKATVSDKESLLYDQLAEKLTSKDFELFLEFLSLYADRYTLYQENTFKTGVKLGFELANELKNIQLY